MTKLIEMVCAGNMGRSPVAELIGRNELRRLGSLGPYDTCSSGVLVSDIMNEVTPPAKVMEKFIRAALERGDVYGSIHTAIAKRVLQNIKDDPVGVDSDHDVRGPMASAVYTDAVARFSEEETGHRAEALKYFGIEGSIKESRTQTMINPSAVAVLGMDPRVTDEIRKMYTGGRGKGHNYNPLIEVLGKLATGDMHVRLPDAFGKGKDEYFRCVEALLDYVPKAIDIALRL